jgi:hypothetical protein
MARTARPTSSATDIAIAHSANCSTGHPAIAIAAPSWPKANATATTVRVLWVFDDIVFFGFIGCVVALVALSIAALVRSMTRSRT